ncbi:MAG TPA: O-antigen ligase family protein, partial [Blastocatellia bacterium]|nr:O-antigen ligase family protein [Blastocatellia bacterium]
TRFEAALWVICFAGLLVSAYAVCQFFGYDPFLPSVLYTSESPEGVVVRVIGTLGHADYLGNFLLYTTPLAACLAIVSSGGARILATVATALSIIAIVCSGTRGAWLGLMCGTVFFAALSLRDRKYASLRLNRRQIAIAAILGSLFILVLALAMSLSTASRSIVQRARLSIAEGFTGSGRTNLWRDSIKMVPAFALTGSGPDNFRKAFLPYKSKELGRIAAVNSENSHNSYLDAAISFGLPGFLLYVAIFLSSLRLLLRTMHRTTNCRLRIMTVGLVSSFGAVAVHNFFIFDQIPTGLYFFAFAALALAASNILGGRNGRSIEGVAIKEPTIPPASRGDALDTPERRAIKAKTAKRHQSLAKTSSWAGTAAVIAGFALTFIATWYSVALMRADAAVNRAMIAADAGDLEQVISFGDRAADSSEITGEYNFLFARALVLCGDRLEMRATVNKAEAGELIAARDRVLELAAARAQRSLVHSQTPDLNYLFLSYLALLTNDVPKLRAYADEAAAWDPNHFRTRWMLAEAYLATGDRYRAAQQAEFALDLNPSSSEAKSVLERARGEIEPPEVRIEEIIARANQKSDAGKTKQARRLLDRALRLSNGRCPECHRALALAYEADKDYQNAIAEWQTFIQEAPYRATAERTTARIQMLKQQR